MSDTPDTTSVDMSVGVRSDKPHRVNVAVDAHTIDAVKWLVIDGLIACEDFEQPSPTKLLRTLLQEVEEDVWAHTGRLFCEVKAEELIDKSNLGRSTVFDASKALQSKKRIRKDPGTGHNASVFEIVLPGQPDEEVKKGDLRRALYAAREAIKAARSTPSSPRSETPAPAAEQTGAPEVSLTQRERALYGGSEGTLGQPRQSDEQSEGSDPRRAPASGTQGAGGSDPRRALASGTLSAMSVDRSTMLDPGRAPWPDPRRALRVDHSPSSNNACAGARASAAALAAAAAAVQGEAPEGTAAALVARDFKRFGLPPAIVQEFDALARPPVVIVAAGLEAETRPKEQQRTGLFIKLVRNPDQISPRHLDRARDKLAPRTTAVRSAPAAAEDPRLADVRAALAMLDEDGLQCLADQVLAAHPTPGDPHHRVLVERRGEIRTHVAWRAALENYVLTASLEQEAS